MHLGGQLSSFRCIELDPRYGRQRRCVNALSGKKSSLIGVMHRIERVISVLVQRRMFLRQQLPLP